ncbi:hypothetical protein K469DRAFT_686317 [Zopfia rhizophila CBS 207.26]|uniref:Uncharacterized protein n=1 Tax=Zopfia rhizophila CBS 207.26 TaxID=1314779 RepID=A0A6A6EBA7_9PEZI|nr:hypothetical protein K469DRAFT_686317 [Zopfia rhizophila CBS 207.26]
MQAQQGNLPHIHTLDVPDPEVMRRRLPREAAQTIAAHQIEDTNAQQPLGRLGCSLTQHGHRNGRRDNRPSLADEDLALLRSSIVRADTWRRIPRRSPFDADNGDPDPQLGPFEMAVRDPRYRLRYGKEAHRALEMHLERRRRDNPNLIIAENSLMAERPDFNTHSPEHPVVQEVL